MSKDNEELRPVEAGGRTGGVPEEPEYPTRDEGDEKLVGGVRLPGHPKIPVKDTRAFKVWDEEAHYATMRRIRREGVEQQIEPIGMALKEQQLAGRQMAAMARTTYEGPGGVRKTIIGPQSMVTFGEGVNFVLGEAHQVLEQLKKEFKAYHVTVEDQFRDLGKLLTHLEKTEASRKNQERLKEVYYIALELALKDAKKGDPGRKNMKTLQQYVMRAADEWDKRRPKIESPYEEE